MQQFVFSQDVNASLLCPKPNISLTGDCEDYLVDTLSDEAFDIIHVSHVCRKFIQLAKVFDADSFADLVNYDLVLLDHHRSG